MLVEERDLLLRGLGLALVGGEAVGRVQHLVELVQVARQRVVLGLHRRLLLLQHVRQRRRRVHLPRRRVLLDHHAQAVGRAGAEARRGAVGAGQHGGGRPHELRPQARQAAERRLHLDWGW